MGKLKNISISFLFIFYFNPFHVIAQTWESAGNDPDEAIYTIVPYSGGYLFGGKFTELFSTPSDLLMHAFVSDTNYTYDPSINFDFNTSPAQNNIPGAVIYDVEEFDGRIHLGGYYYLPSQVEIQSIGYLEFDLFASFYIYYKYNSTMGAGNWVHALQKFNNKLFIGGYYTNWDSTNYISYINSGNYPDPVPVTPGSGLNGTVRCLIIFNNELYAGGTFTLSGTTTVNNIAKWNGTDWEALGAGINGTVFSMTVYNNALIVGGSFTTAGGVPTNNVAKWNGASWSALSSGLTGSGAEIDALEVYGTKLYAGGIFTTSGSSTMINLAAWDGTVWDNVGAGVNNRVRLLKAFNNRLYISGDFNFANAVYHNHLVIYNDGSQTSITEEKTEKPDLNFYPNPANNIVTISSEKLISEIQVTDLSGKTLITVNNIVSKNCSLNIDNLATGVYILKIKTGDGWIIKKFVKER